MKSTRWIILLCLLWPLAGGAQQDTIKVIGLFSDKALVQINGNQHLIKKNQTIDGITLLSASGRGARIRFADGIEKTLNLNQSIGHGFKKRDNKKLVLYTTRNGMYELAGKINGQPSKFLLDTGATFVAMSRPQADQLGLAYETGLQTRVKTANALVGAWYIKLDQVSVGGIRVSNVDAVVIDTEQSGSILLGMSFLKHLKMERDGAAMVLEQKY
jgi:aspartyl protease family protein